MWILSKENFLHCNKSSESEVVKGRPRAMSPMSNNWWPPLSPKLSNNCEQPNLLGSVCYIWQVNEVSMHETISRSSIEDNTWKLIQQHRFFTKTSCKIK